MQPTVALAVEDYLPVLLSFLGLLWLVQMVFRMYRPAGYLAAVGLALIFAGGFLKATEKLLGATTGQGVSWMNDSLFVLLGPGFTCVAWAVWCGQRAAAGRSSPKPIWLVPTVISAVALGAAAYAAATQTGRGWFFIMLTLTVLATVATIVLLIRQSWQQNMRVVSLALVVYLFATLMLNGMARTPSETLAVAWGKQMVNTAASGIFAFAAYHLSRATIQLLRLDSQTLRVFGNP